MRTYKPVGIRVLICEDCSEQFEAKRNDRTRCKPCAAARRREWVIVYDRARDRTQLCGCGALMDEKSAMCRKCKGIAQRGAGNSSWKGGKTMHHAGYIQTRTNRPGRSNGYELDHRLVWEAANGPIPAGHVIHHINGNKLDNRLENLMCLSNSAHQHMHDDVDQARSHHIQDRDAEIASLRARIRELEGTNQPEGISIQTSRQTAGDRV